MTTPITLAPHLAQVVDRMSKDMAVAPEALVNQAVFAWLRANGYEAPRTKRPEPVSPEPVPPEPVPPEPVPPGLSELVEDGPSKSSVVGPSSTGSDGSDRPGEVSSPSPSPVAAVLARMAEIDADLEKLTRPLPAWVEEAEEEERAVEEPHTGKVPVEPEPEPEEEEAPESTIVLRSVPIALYLQRGEAEPLRITKERFVVGRGPHCDLVIDSPRVSREHVALTRAGISFFIEDLGSSNGTWFGEERVTKKELESGDVINLGNEPVTFFLRGE